MSDAMSRTGLEIAIIGMAGRFPGAQNIHEFWENLKDGVESISFFSDRELEKDGGDTASINDPSFVKARGLFEGVKYFDAAFFGYTPIEAKVMDPQLRIFHECSWEALEDAGYNPGTYKGKIGIYGGATMNLNWQVLSVLSSAAGGLDAFSASQLMNKDYLTMRISFNFNLRGPSFVVQTACSTSLVAIHLASQGLLGGECSMALAGGVTVTVPQKSGYIYQEGMVMSSDGHCRAFDAAANGLISGDGAGVVTLKLLENAIVDGDYIYAVIKGSAVNNDGNQKSGFTAPSIKAQKEVIKEALSIAEVEPESISYVETHGTGTPLGDPMEIESLKRAFNTKKRGFCKIGSVKTNVGHMDAAAGVGGFIKTIMALKHRQIPPSLHFKTPNPKIDFENSPFIVNTQLTPWENGKYPLRAGVTSLGIGGTNAHVVLEEWPAASQAAGWYVGRSVDRPYQLILLLSAKTKSTLDKMTKNLVEYLKKNLLNRGNLENPTNPGQTLADVAFTLQVGRKALEHRRMTLCSTRDDAVTALSDFTNIPYNLTVKDKPGIVFMFAGLGSQYVNMGLELYQKEPVFREEMDRCFEIINTLVDYDIKEILYPGEMHNRSHKTNKSYIPPINQIEISQLVVFTIEYALSRLLMKWGVSPDAMIGYSFGEYTTACLSGVFSLEDALKLIVCRGKLLRQIPGGTMLSVPLTSPEITPLLTGELSIAIDNGSSCIIAGPEAVVAAFAQEMKQKKLMCMPVPHSVAMHSQMMDSILAKFEEELGKISLNPPKTPYISNVTGTWITVEEVVTPRYWRNHLRETVRFADGLRKLLKRSPSVFIEIGPGRDLSTMLSRFINNKSGHKVLNLVRLPGKNQPDVYYLLNKVGYLWLYGVNIDWEAFYSREKRCRVPLPTYPFERKRYWFDGNPLKAARQMLLSRSLPGKEPDMKDWFYIPQWNRSALPFDIGVSREPACWLLFINESLLGAHLVQRLKKDKHHIIIARPGLTFGSLSSHEYTINPTKNDDYDRLFKKLVKSGNIPIKIVHLWSLTGNGKNVALEELDRTQDLGLYSLLGIVQAVGKNSISTNIKIGVITDSMQPVTGEEDLCPEKATILGPVKVIPLEYPNIKCLSLDICDPGQDKQRMNVIIDSLIREFSTNVPDFRVVAYRGTYRWIESYEPVKPDSSSRETILKEKGVYLVTGGFGGMGFTLVEYLAKAVKARLVLVDILTPPSGEKLDEWLTSEDRKRDIHLKKQQIKELEKIGAEIKIHDADVSDYLQMKEVIAKVEEGFGRINGVIHTAGLIDYAGVIQGRSRQMTVELLAAKVKGTLVLDVLLKNHHLDFLVLFSSIGNIFYKMKFGQVGYNAGHEFLDVFAYQKQKQGTFTITIDWNDWLEKGMSARVTNNENNFNKKNDMIDLLAITPSEGIEVFNRILGNDSLCRVIVSTVNIGAALDFMNHPREEMFDNNSLDSLAEEEISQLPPESHRLRTPYKEPANDIQRTIARLWEKFFGIKPVGIHDDFFELGGDSLKAINVSAMIQKELNVEIPVAEFFNRQTVEGLAEYVTTAEVPGDDFPIKPVEKKEYYPVSSAQRRLYVLQQMGETSTGYNETMVLTLEGNLVKERLEDAFKLLIRRHESLMTSFELIGGKPVQRVHDEVEFAVDYFDVKETVGQDPGSSGHSQERLVKGIVHRFIRPFDLTRRHLLRVGVIHTPRPLRGSNSQEGNNGGKHILIVDMHHIIRDGVSQGIFFEEFMNLYEGQELPAFLIQYKDFTQWQNHLLESGKIKDQEEYWLKEFADEVPVLNLPTDYSRPALVSFKGNYITDVIDNKETMALKKMASEQDVTLFIVLLAVFNIFLSKLSGQEDIVCGAVSAGRRYTELKKIIGMFVNTLALRNYSCSSKTFIKFLMDVREKTLNAYENQDYQFEILVDKMVKNRDTSRNPLFDVMFAFHNFLEAQGEILNQEMDGLRLKPYPFKDSTAKFDLTLNLYEDRGQLYFAFVYCTELFKEETVVRFIRYFKKIIGSVLQAPGVRLSDIEIIPEKEKKQICFDFNDTAAEYPNDKVIHELFEQHVEKTPGKIALVGSEERTGQLVQLSYRHLNEKSHQFAGMLREKGVTPDSIAAIIIERSIEMMVGIFAILKAGGAYLAIAPDYPRDRIRYMLADSSAKVLLTTRDLYGKFTDKIETIYPEAGTCGHQSQPGYTVSPPCSSNLAYIIYTSGSTSRPKGILVEHYSVVNLVCSQRKCFRVNDSDRILQFSPIYFDASVEQIFIALSSGAALVLISKEAILDHDRFEKYISMQLVTHIHAVPSFLNNMKIKPFSSLKRVISGGDICPVALAKKWSQVCDFYNEYGPTETTVTSIEMHMKPVDETLYVLPIGKPISNTIVYILDKLMKPVPLNIAGELVIGGEGVVRGYLNNPELTVEKFRNDQYSITNDRLYHTGDLARWLPDGNVEFLGRIDYQVKIRGFRVELGEIENQLLKHEEIERAVVLLEETTAGSTTTTSEDNRYLSAYIVSDRKFNVSQLREYLSAELPDYMIPSYFVQVESIPLNYNGKVDRRALEKSADRLATGVKFEAPKNDFEKKILEIWKEVLHRDKVGVNDNFFDLGGNSIDIIKANSKLKEVLKKDIPVVSFFRYTTIKSFVQYLGQEVVDGFHKSDRSEALKKGEDSKMRRLKARRRM